MKVDIDIEGMRPPCRDDMVGNVYAIRGGFGARNGHMHVIISNYDKVMGCCKYAGYVTVTVDAEGDIVGANNYAHHYFDNKMPIAKCDGIEDIHLVIRSLNP